MDSHWTRYVLGFAVLHFAGVLPTPPLFKFLYKIYCSEVVGYKYIRPMLHRRFSASHAEYFPAVRSLRKGDGFVCKNQRELSKELRKLAEASVSSSRAAEDNSNDDSNNNNNNKDVLIFPIPVLSDNYAYALVYPSAASSRGVGTATTGAPIELSCALIDAADPHRIILELERQLILAGSAEAAASVASEVGGSNGGCVRRITLNITHILTTHKHWDHAGGNKELADMAKLATSSVSVDKKNGKAAPLMAPDLRYRLVMEVNQIEAERRRTERKRQKLNRKNAPKSETALDPATLKPMRMAVEDELDNSSDDETYVAAKKNKESSSTTSPATTSATSSSSVLFSNHLQAKKSNYDIFTHLFAECDEAIVSGLITFDKELPFIGSKVDNPHCTNTFVSNYNKIHLGGSANNNKKRNNFGDSIIDASFKGEKSTTGSDTDGSFATITVLDAPGHTCGSVMFLLSLNETAEKKAFVAETKERITAAISSNDAAASNKLSSPAMQMSKTIHRALFTGDCIFCGGCGAMFETKSARETLQTYDCFMGSTLTAFPLRRNENPTKATKAEVKKDDKREPEMDPLFYISSRNVMLFVGHEYTLKLMGQLMEMVASAKEKLITNSEAAAKKEIEERQLRGEPAVPFDVEEAQKNKDISTVALDEILAEAAAKGGHHDDSSKNNKNKAGIASKPTKVLPLRPHHAAIEQRWAQINAIQNAYHPLAATVPSSLYEERRTNPLLTLERSVLTGLVAINAHASRIEEEVYGSDKRRTDL